MLTKEIAKDIKMIARSKFILGKDRRGLVEQSMRQSWQNSLMLSQKSMTKLGLSSQLDS